MASTIKIKNSTTEGNAPSSLAQGELAINVEDGTLFYGTTSGNKVSSSFAVSQITASGNISSSGNIFASSMTATSITASGDISSSGTITAEDIVVNDDLTIGDDATINGNLITFRPLDNSTAVLRLMDDSNDFFTDIEQSDHFHIDASHHTAMNVAISTNKFDTGNNVDTTATTANAHIFLDGGTGETVIKGTPIYFGNDTDASTAVFNGHITSSGNISSSGIITAEHFESSDDITAAGTIQAEQITSTDDASVAGDLVLGSSILHSGDIDTKIQFSADDQIDLNTGGSVKIRLANTLNNLNQDTKVSGDLEVTSHITASGNISASGDIIAQQLFVREDGTGGIIFDGDGSQGSDGFIGLINEGINIYANGGNPGASTHLFVSQSGGTGMGHGKVGINTITPNEHLEVVGNISASGTISGQVGLIRHNITSDTATDAKGDVVYFGSGDGLDAGKIHHYKSDGSWEIANATAVATSDGLLGVALETAPSGGILLRGMVTLDHDPGTTGQPLYLDTGNNGQAIHTISSTDNHIVRVIGYCLDDDDGQIWFNPDSTFVEITA